MAYQIWVGFIFVYQKSLKRTFKPGFKYKIPFWICVLVLWIHNCYFVVKKLVWHTTCSYLFLLYFSLNKLLNFVFQQSPLFVLKLTEFIEFYKFSEKCKLNILICIDRFYNNNRSDINRWLKCKMSSSEFFHRLPFFLLSFYLTDQSHMHSDLRQIRDCINVL